MNDIQNALVEALRNSAPSRRLMHTAADEIETLENYKALYEDLTDRAQKLARRILSQFPAWIPVTDRLPDIGDSVIVSGKMKYQWEKEYERFVDVGIYNEEGAFETFIDWYEGQQEFKITHWMPLPDPPEEVEA